MVGLLAAMFNLLEFQILPVESPIGIYTGRISNSGRLDFLPNC